MHIEALIKHSTEVSKIILKSTKSEDSILSSFLRSRKYIGSKERKIVSEIVFLHLRNKKFSDFLFNEIFGNSNLLEAKKEVNFVTEEHLLLSLFLNSILYPKNLFNICDAIQQLYKTGEPLEFLQNIIIDQFKKKISFDKQLFLNNINFFENNLLHTSKTNEIIKNTKMTPIQDDALHLASIRYSIPEFILESWSNYYQPKGINVYTLAESLLFPAPITLRINPMKTKRSEILNQLNNKGIVARATLYSTFGINLEKRINLIEYDIYKNGLVEVQDEGSQLVCFAVNPNKNDKILDACSGAGGKTLLLAQMQEDKGKIVANDINFLKLRELEHRARRAKLKSIRTYYNKDGKFLFKDEFDKVLIDAPCSGIGTARRNPMHKWRLNPEKLKKIARKQLELLQFYSKFVRKNGTLVYSTCSLMPEENIFVIQKFLNENTNFEPYSLKENFFDHRINLEWDNDNDFYLTLFPSIHKTDGFFICKLRKIR